jgi:hypothetical protein
MKKKKRPIWFKFTICLIGACNAFNVNKNSFYLFLLSLLYNSVGRILFIHNGEGVSDALR